LKQIIQLFQSTGTKKYLLFADLEKNKETAAGDARFLQHINTFNQIKKYEKNYNLNSYVFPYLDAVKISLFQPHCKFLT
jgi:hypothetical protein